MLRRVRSLLLDADGNRIAEILVGDDWSRDCQKWVRRDRFISRFLDLYNETVVDRESGDVIHYCHERLSEHTGHGSAKPPRPRFLSDGSEIPFLADWKNGEPGQFRTNPDKISELGLDSKP